MAVRLRPQLVETYVNWGNVLTEQGKFAEAKALYREALERKPDDAEAQYRLGCASEFQ